MADLRVLIIGAGGVFGSRLARLAAREEGISLILAGRTSAKLEELAGELESPAAIKVLDRDAIAASDLQDCDIVVDAAGPFQASHSRVIEAAIAARKPYIDLADARDFLRDFPRHDAAAKAAGIAMVAGASSIPALSHAVIDDLTEGWRGIESIRVGIFPGNRAPRGLSVVKAILSYVGKPVRVFREGAWQDVPGWGMLHRVDVPGIGRRWACVCDTPEQDLLVARYRPRRDAEFFAGMELGLLHVGLALLAWPVRLGWLKSLRPFARPMLTMARWLLPFGSDRGGMVIRVQGEDASGLPTERVWTLRTNANRGPFVPVLAALALLRKHRDGKASAPGAQACSGILSLPDFAADFARLGMTKTVHERKHFPERRLTRQFSETSQRLA